MFARSAHFTTKEHPWPLGDSPLLYLHSFSRFVFTGRRGGGGAEPPSLHFTSLMHSPRILLPLPHCHQALPGVNRHSAEESIELEFVRLRVGCILATATTTASLLLIFSSSHDGNVSFHAMITTHTRYTANVLATLRPPPLYSSLRFSISF